MAVVHERWLQRVNATETSGGIAVTAANEMDAPLFRWTRQRHMPLKTTCCARENARMG